MLDATDNPLTLDQVRTVANSTTGNLAVPFSAQYYRLATGVMTGTVRASTTYTMSYQ